MLPTAVATRYNEHPEAMAPPTPDDVTRLLNAMRSGDSAARSDLAAALYPQLRKLAQSFMRSERTGHTLQPTALVNEAYLRLWTGNLDYINRAHLVSVAAQVMRQILVDHARRRRSQKRGGDRHRVDIEIVVSSAEAHNSDRLLELDRALALLSDLDPRQSQIVEMRFFAGLTEEEIAEVLGISSRTVKRDWQLAKAWLYTQMGR